MTLLSPFQSIAMVILAALVVGLIVHAAQWYRALGQSRLVFKDEITPRLSKPRPWTGEGSKTEMQILHHLQYGPMTRHQLNEVLDVTTAGIYLPKLVARQKVRIIDGTWPFRYELIERPGSVNDALVFKDETISTDQYRTERQVILDAAQADQRKRLDAAVRLPGSLITPDRPWRRL